MSAAHETFGTFGERLRAQRESQGVSLQAIADSTKIGLSLLAALERNDLSRWPKGIFRRAFFREYVTAIGLSPEPMLAEFARLFPDDPREPAETHELRLVMDAGECSRETGKGTRALVAFVEFFAVVSLGVTSAWILNMHALTTSGIIALLYYPFANACIDRATLLGLLNTDGERRSFEWMRVLARARHLLRAISSQRIASWRHAPQQPSDETTSASSEWRTASN